MILFCRNPLKMELFREEVQDNDIITIKNRTILPKAAEKWYCSAETPLKMELFREEVQDNDIIMLKIELFHPKQRNNDITTVNHGFMLKISKLLLNCGFYTYVPKHFYNLLIKFQSCSLFSKVFKALLSKKCRQTTFLRVICQTIKQQRFHFCFWHFMLDLSSHFMILY